MNKFLEILNQKIAGEYRSLIYGITFGFVFLSIVVFVKGIQTSTFIKSTLMLLVMIFYILVFIFQRLIADRATQKIRDLYQKDIDLDMRSVLQQTYVFGDKSWAILIAIIPAYIFMAVLSSIYVATISTIVALSLILLRDIQLKWIFLDKDFTDVTETEEMIN